MGVSFGVRVVGPANEVKGSGFIDDRVELPLLQRKGLSVFFVSSSQEDGGDFGVWLRVRILNSLVFSLLKGVLHGYRLGRPVRNDLAFVLTASEFVQAQTVSPKVIF
jgi:hypothetical protein